MTPVTQGVILRWEEGDVERNQKLYDVQPDGNGRLSWAAVEEAFGADLVEIKGESNPELLQSGDR